MDEFVAVAADLCCMKMFSQSFMPLLNMLDLIKDLNTSTRQVDAVLGFVLLYAML